MFRSYLTFGLQVFVVLIWCSATKSTISKRLQKCQEYSTQIYGQAVPICESSSASSGVITIQQFPYIAVLGYRDYNDETIDWLCHGTLVSSRYILTTGRCLRNARGLVPIKARLGATSNPYSGETNSSDYDIEKIIVHPDFKIKIYYNDVGLVKLTRTVKISESVRPICLPDSDLQSNILSQVNYENRISRDRPQRPLTKYEHTAVSNEDCNEIYSPFFNVAFRNGITEGLMCSRQFSNTSSEYSCLGESGAPLYIDHPRVLCSHIQLGIVSFLMDCLTDIPDIATKVFSVADWIETVIWAHDENL